MSAKACDIAVLWEGGGIEHIQYIPPFAAADRLSHFASERFGPRLFLGISFHRAPVASVPPTPHLRAATFNKALHTHSNRANIVLLWSPFSAARVCVRVCVRLFNFHLSVPRWGPNAQANYALWA